jgi:activator of HSP90 ATPase
MAAKKKTTKKTPKPARSAKAKPKTHVKARPKPAAKPKVRPRAKAKAKAMPKPVARAKPKATAAPRSKRAPGASAARAPGAQTTRPPHIPPGPTELDTIKLAYLFRDTSPSAIYRALIDAAEHAAFTGDEAEIDPRVGGAFRSYSGFIQGTTLELVPDARIVQSWRTKHFPKNNPDSTLELTFTPVPEGTRLEMRHLGVPKE